MPNDTRNPPASESEDLEISDAEPSISDAFRPTLLSFFLSLFQMGFRQKTSPPLAAIPKRRKGGKGRVKERLVLKGEEAKKAEEPEASKEPEPPKTSKEEASPLPLPSGASPVRFSDALLIVSQDFPLANVGGFQNFTPSLRGFTFSSAATPFPTPKEEESQPLSPSLGVPWVPPSQVCTPPSSHTERALLPLVRKRSAMDTRFARIEPLTLTLPLPVLAAYPRPYEVGLDGRQMPPLVYRFRQGELDAVPPFPPLESSEAEVTLSFSYLASLWMEQRQAYEHSLPPSQRVTPSDANLAFSLVGAEFHAPDTAISWANKVCWTKKARPIHIAPPAPVERSGIRLSFRSFFQRAGAVHPSTLRSWDSFAGQFDRAGLSDVAKGFSWKAGNQRGEDAPLRNRSFPGFADEVVERDGSLAFFVLLGQIPVMQGLMVPLGGDSLPSWDGGFGIYEPKLTLHFEVFRQFPRDLVNA